MPDATSPDSITQSTSADKLERDDWVDMQLVQNYMQSTQRSMPASMLVTWLLAAVLYKVAPQLELVIWLVLSNIVILFRYLVVLQYQNTMKNASGPALRAFLARYDVLWVLSGVLWGASSFLFFGKSSGFEQFICGLILIGVSCFSVYTYASRLPCFFSFTNALTGTAVLVFIYQLLIEKALPSTGDSLGLIALAVIFQMMVRYFGIRFYALQRQSLQLQFDNRELVESLTAKSVAALEAVENKNRFIASAAHDLRQPVHALNLYASLLIDDPQLSQQVAPQIVRCTNAVNDLFNSLFDFSGMNAETPTPHWQAVNLAELLVDLRHQYAPLAQEGGLQLKLYKGSALTSARSDPVLLKRLLGNLISNALKNTTQGGVLLALRERPGHWRIEVWDTGVGIEPKHQEAIFKEFYRVPRQGTEEGFGLGLAIVSRLSQVLGLAVKMRSQPGRGSVFWIEGKVALPAIAADTGQATRDLGS
jgi:signal transduction histidine kinase